MGSALEKMPGAMVLLPQCIIRLSLEELQELLALEGTAASSCASDKAAAAQQYEMMLTRRYMKVFVGTFILILLLWLVAVVAFNLDGGSIFLLPLAWPTALILSSVSKPLKS
mmetsp:Transcript_61022/g.145400  ORF Transcript_61022/g.145400 Transcript_61022/m.145400 type:complete len:112 (+) Transcript_61022:105-440(+)